MVVEQEQVDLVERGLDGLNLVDDVDAVFILFDHAHHAVDVTGDGAQAVQQVLFDVLILGHR